MEAYLGWYKNTWPKIRPAEEHRHEVGQDTSQCETCSLAEYERRLNDFERFCLVWFYRNFNAFTYRTGMIGDMIKALNLNENQKDVFLFAMNMVFQTQLEIEHEKAEKEGGK